MRTVRLSMVLAAALAAGPFLAAPARGDVVRLNDGSTVEGIVKRNGDGYDVTDAAGKLSHIPSENVRGIELTAKAAGAGEAESRLGSLRRSVENISDFKVIFERYARFIEQNKDTPIAKEAEKDVSIWHDRVNRAMVKVGTKWVTPDERAAMQEKGMMAADEARQLLKQGRMKDAEPVLNQAIEEDPTNVGALYLRGWLLYNQEQLQASRKAFEAAQAILKDHAPTLNNLAVVVWRLNSQVQALGLYDQAMLASPLNREVLDNVSEALEALPVKQRQAVLVQKAARHFAEQDTLLQQQMAQRGWYRWGSTWVDRTQLEQLKVADAELQKKLAALSDEFDATRKKVQRIDDDIDDNLRRMRVLETTSYARDTQGNYVRLPLPSRYYDYEADNKKLARDREVEVAKLEGLRAEAKRQQQSMPMPRFKAVQKLIGLEGTPILPPTRGATVNVEPAPRQANPPAPPTTAPAPPGPAPVVPATRPTGTSPASRQPLPDSLLSQ